MPYQTAWLEKIKSLPDEILSRLPNPIEGRCFLLGPGADQFKPALESVCKVFVGTEAQLSAFPKGTFDLIISLWSLSPSEPLKTLNHIRSALKDDGQCAVVTYIENTPEAPLKILKKVLKDVSSVRASPLSRGDTGVCKELKLYKPALPDSAGQFRRMLGKCWFKDVRVFKDKIICRYESADDLYNDMAASIFGMNVPAAVKSQIQTAFIKEAGKLLADTKGIIEHHFVGAISLK